MDDALLKKNPQIINCMCVQPHIHVEAYYTLMESLGVVETFSIRSGGCLTTFMKTSKKGGEIMTTMGLQYLQYQETKRNNQAVESETHRSNVAREVETARSNLAREVETNRSNVARETETHRANLANETENYRSHRANEIETNRSNLAREAETNRHNEVTEVETNRANLAKEAETNRANVVKETETNRANLAKEANQYRELLEKQRSNTISALKDTKASAGVNIKGIGVSGQTTAAANYAINTDQRTSRGGINQMYAGKYNDVLGADPTAQASYFATREEAQAELDRQNLAVRATAQIKLVPGQGWIIQHIK